MTRIRFVGDLPLWAGAILALLAALGVWWYYRRESDQLPGRLRWLLPLLRASTVFVVLMTLTGPVLHHRHIMGELGRVFVFVDASGSMGVSDRHMPTARKLLAAQQQGWLPPGQVETTLWETANRLQQMRRDVTSSLEQTPLDEATLAACRDSLRRVAADVADVVDRFAWTTLLTVDGEGLANWNEVPTQFRRDFVEPAEALTNPSSSESLSAEETTRRLLELCQAAATYEARLRAAFDSYGRQLAAAGNPAIDSALSLFDDTSRWRRAEHTLLDNAAGLLPALSDTHDVQLMGLVAERAVDIWDPQATSEAPTQLGLEPTARATDLASGISGELTMRLGGSEDTIDQAGARQRTAVVLLSDGRHNSGDSPLQMAQLLGGQSIPIYAVGYGGWREPPDLALIEVQHPDMVFQKDRIRGSILLSDHMPPGQSFVVQIGYEDEILWQNSLTSRDVGQRRVEFEFSVESLVEELSQGFDEDLRHHSLPLTLAVSIAPLEGEIETANNSLTMRFAAITQNYKILLLDGRARWETRYLRNMFQRDEQWQIDAILVGPATDQATLPRGDEPGMFPTDKTKLFDYDLIFFGELAPGTLTDYELGWIRDFVEIRGGGIVFIDGQRGYLRSQEDERFAPLLPVDWLPEVVGQLPTRLELTETGGRRSALMLRTSPLENERFWETLPPPGQLVAVQAAPDTEVLAQVWAGTRRLPLLVTRSFGAGRVLYFASDETWRWRYKVADTYHQRFWNQVAKWVMQRPFAVSDAYVALDSGPPSYAAGDSADLRVRLRGTDGRPVLDATVDALLWKDGRIVSTVHLTATDSGSGIYSGRSGPLAEGNYEVSVRAAGFANDALRARTELVVEPPKSGELEEVSCHVDLMRELASVSGGKFLREEDVGQLADLLRPLSTGRVIESDTVLWQSYWWFSLLVVLLAIEWYLRKRAGLL
jgi:uncharacterized membrane protein